MGTSTSKSKPEAFYSARGRRSTNGYSSYYNPPLSPDYNYEYGQSAAPSYGPEFSNPHGPGPSPQYGYGRSPNHSQGYIPNEGPSMQYSPNHGRPVIPDGRSFIPKDRLVIPDGGPVIPGRHYHPQAQQLNPRGDLRAFSEADIPRPRLAITDGHTQHTTQTQATEDPQEIQRRASTGHRASRRHRSKRSAPIATISLSLGNAQTNIERPPDEAPQANTQPASPEPDSPSRRRLVQGRVATPFHPSPRSVPQSSPSSQSHSTSHFSILSSPPLSSSAQTSPGTTVEQHSQPASRVQTLRNPLPEPPRDIYTMSPYKHLLEPKELPPVATPSDQGMFVRRETITTTRPRRSLFRVFSGKKAKPPHETKTVEYLYYPPASTPPYHPQLSTSALQRSNTLTQSQQQPMSTFTDPGPSYPEPPPQMTRALGPSTHQEPPPPPTPHLHTSPPARQRTVSPRQPTPDGPAHTASPPPPPMPSTSAAAAAAAAAPNARNPSPAQSTHEPAWPPPPRANPQEPVYFDQDSEFSAFLLHAPYPVLYQDRMYPTAAHLLEALKYLPEHPQVAEQVRRCEDTEDLYTVSAEYANMEKEGYARDVADYAHMVTSTKFKQHADLRYQLCGTAPAQLKYNDPADSFWGVGPNGDGQNELGLILERVRAEMQPKSR